MSSINSHYTFQYSQPEEYHFSHDSVFLARRVFELLQGTSLAGQRVLDLCAGCGIVGLDFLFHCMRDGRVLPASCDFLEVQQVYSEHFVRNRKFVSDLPLNFLCQNYAELARPEAEGTYDLILCNPPYFRQGQGKLSPSKFKNRCRFFIDSDFATLLRVIENILKPGGSAYLLLRDLIDHKWHAEVETRNLLSSNIKLIRLDEIRGTGFFAIHKRVQ